MSCRRCLGLMVSERWVVIDRRSPSPHSSLLTPHFFTRCVNCGNIEDPVILLNRSRVLTAGRWEYPPTSAEIAHQLLDDLFKTLTR